MTQPTLTVELGYLSGWTLGTSLLGTDTYLAEVTYSQDISADVRSVSIRRGRQHELNRIEAGTASVQVLNQDGAMTRIPPMTNIRIRADFAEAVFIPSDIAGLRAWWDFSVAASNLWQDTARTTPVTADGQVVKGVTDKSGNGFHLSEATNGPTYKTAIQNGLSVARFDGANDQLGVTGITAPSTGATWFITVDKVGALNANSQVALSTRSDNIGLLYTDTDASATNYNYYQGEGATVVPNVATAPLTAKIVALRLNSISSMDIYSNGGTPVNLDPNGALSAFTAAYLGAHAGTLFGDYDIGEVVLYNSALAAADMNLVGAYLASKWGFTWTTV